ncbi:MAG: T9SS type A sorting domain-containing protein [Cyclobacteriaceae bacterium]
MGQGVFSPIVRQDPYIRGVNSPFGYYEYLPSGYGVDSTEKFPLLIYLSGLESKGDGVDDLELVLENGVAKLINEGQTFPFLVMAPQSWSGWWGNDNLTDYLDYVLDNYQVDAHRVYLTGISSGGAGAFSYAAEFPEKIAAVVPISGRGDNLEVCDMTDVLVWAFHNMDDAVFSHQFSIIPVNKFNLCDPAPVPKAKVTIYPDGGHNAWTKTYSGSGMGSEDPLYDAFDMDIFDWLLQFAKDTIIVGAGEDQVVFRPHANLQIEARAASQDGLHTYVWTQLEGPTLALENLETAILAAEDVPVGEYVFQVTATDNIGRSTSDTVKVQFRPPNASPTVDAGKEQTVILPIDSVTLRGVATDPENDAISMVWEQEEGPEPATMQFDSILDSTRLVVKNLQEGEYTFRLKATDAYDSVGTHTVRLRVISPPAGTINDFPYSDSFEQTSEEGWQAYGTINSWEQGVPEGQAIHTASEGDQVWATNLSGNYQPDESSFLLSPVFDFSALTHDPTITYDLWLQTAPEDRVQFSYTTDQGVTWNTYALADETTVANDSNGWVSMTRTLEGLAGQKSVLFRVELQAGSAGANEGIAFDQVVVCSTGNIMSISDTLVTEGETLSLPITLDNADIGEITYQAISDNQEVLPDGNITISGNVLQITSPVQVAGETEITIFSPDDCINETTFTLTVARVTAIDELENPAPRLLYPNPGTGYYQLDIHEPITAVRLYSLEGKLLKQYAGTTNTGEPYLLDITPQPNGIYYLLVETNKEVITHKLIKQ